MRVVAQSTDPIRLNWLSAILAEAGIASVMLDEHMSILEGSISAIPRRLAVAEADASRATAILKAAES